MRDGNGNRGNAGQQQQQPPQGAQQVTPLALQPTYQTAAEIRRRERLKVVHHRMVEYVEQLFVKPRQEYLRRVHWNAQKLRVKQATLQLKKNSMADRVATAVQAEGSTTPRTIRVLIKEGIENANKKKAASTSSKSSNSSKNSAGAQQQGGALQKKKSPASSKKNRGRATSKQSGARGKGNATDGDDSRDKKPRSKSKSRGSGKRSSTKGRRSKSKSTRK